MKTQIPIYRAKKMYANEYVIGYYYKVYNTHNIRPISSNGNVTEMVGYEIVLSTLEIFDGIKWRKLSECHFRTDREMDMHLKDGYCQGWNSALSDNQTRPSDKFKYLEE